ncbi:hypothetical protein FOZ63_012553, partial [Perkinsus olseni]
MMDVPIHHIVLCNITIIQSNGTTVIIYRIIVITIVIMMLLLFRSGAFDNLEALKRTTFDTWGLDTGLLRGIMQHIVIPHYNYINSDVMSIGDLGAGGGHYSQWFNNTGIVYAYAFDGINDITNITHGRVSYMDLTSPIISAVEQGVGRVFDWVMSIEVAEHIPKQYSQTLVSNWNSMARYGMIISWSDQLM